MIKRADKTHTCVMTGTANQIGAVNEIIDSVIGKLQTRNSHRRFAKGNLRLEMKVTCILVSTKSGTISMLDPVPLTCNSVMGEQPRSLVEKAVEQRLGGEITKGDAGAYMGIFGIQEHTKPDGTYVCELLVLYRVNEATEGMLAAGYASYAKLPCFVQETFARSHNQPLHTMKLYSEIPEQRKDQITEFKDESEYFGSLEFVAFLILLNEKSEILLVKEKTGLLFLPAGHIDPGETFATGATRECLEEVGIVPTILGVHVMLYEVSSHSWAPFRIGFVAKVGGGALKKHKDMESDGGMWVPLVQVWKEINDPATRTKYRKWERLGAHIGTFVDSGQFDDDGNFKPGPLVYFKSS